MIKNKNKLCLLCLILALLLAVTVAAAQSVYVGGMPFGVRFESGEVTVIKTSEFVSDGKNVSPAKEAGMLANDVIKEINGYPINSSNDVIDAVRATQGDTIDLLIVRKNKEIPIKIEVKKSDITGEIQLGVLLKDSSAGIGTVTFIEKDTLAFAGLGHGICDNLSGKVLNIENGYISNVIINGVNKGKSGVPGELKGAIDSEKCGKLIANTEVGVYGVFNNIPKNTNKIIDTAEFSEVKEGRASIICTVDGGECKEYDIEIADIDHNSSAKTKNYIIKITDKELLNKTGGIVQGMSGSPIIQNGKLIGAITHVMINDPTTGYGIYIGNMIEEMNKAF